MVDVPQSTATSQAELKSLMGLNGLSGAGALPTVFAPPPDIAARGEQVSVAGVMVLSAVSVAMTIMAVAWLALIFIAGWWLISHIPIPHVVWQILGKLGLA
jgi:hypothetical protein